jgi:hypothetical protein
MWASIFLYNEFILLHYYILVRQTVKCTNIVLESFSITLILFCRLRIYKEV